MSTFENPSDEAIRELLEQVRNIAVVGLSPKPDRPSYVVAHHLKGYGYRVIPVRPATGEILGEKTWPDLESVPDAVDLVDVFRAPEHVDPIVDTCIARGIKALWLQEGVVNEAAAQRARAAGITVVMDRCIFKECAALLGGR